MARRRFRKKMKFPKRLDSLLDGVYPSKRGLGEARIFALWPKVVSTRVDKIAQPVFFNKGILFVHVSSTTWANELTLLKRDFIRRYKAYLSPCPVRDMRFRVGPLPDIVRHEIPKPAPPMPASDLPPVVGRALAHIKDDGLREVVTRAALSSMAREESNKDE